MRTLGIRKCMNWQTVSFDWNQVRGFLATAEEGSLSAAARALGLTQPTLGRQVAALEEALDVTLFERGPRGLILTPTGQDLLEHVREMAEAASRVSLAASGRAESIEGKVKVSASEMLSAWILPAILAKLRVSYPGIEVEIVSTNELSDLRHREADIAVRNTVPEDPDMIAKRLRDSEAGVFGATSLLDTLPPIRTLADLADVPFIGFGDAPEFLPALQSRGIPVTARNIVSGSRSHIVHWSLVEAGIGLGMNSAEFAATRPGIQRVLPELAKFSFPIYLVAPRELNSSRRVRIVFDALSDGLARPAT